MKVRETDLPGIGRKFEVAVQGGDRLVIVVHYDGRREFHHFYHNEPDSSASMITMDDEDARLVAGIIGGMTYKPEALETVDIVLDNLVIEWYKIEEGAKCVGRAVGEMQVRQRTGANIIAVVERDHKKYINPHPDYVFVAGSIAIIAGERKHVRLLKEYLFSGEAAGV